MRKGLLIILLSSCCAFIYAQKWQPLGPIGTEKYSLKNSAWAGGTGQIHSFAYAAKTGGYDWYCVSPFGGLWKSVDQGHQWTDLNPQLQKAAGICSAIDVAVDPHTPSVIYVATGSIDKTSRPDAPSVPSTGIFLSKDGGSTFQRSGFKFNYEDNNHIARLIANPWSKEGATQLFAATDKGLFVNQSGVDKKWTRVLDDEKLFTVAISPDFNQNHTVYAAGDDIYISRKDGSKNSFSPLQPSIADQLPGLKDKRMINIAIANRAGTDIIYAMVYQDDKDYFLCYDGSKWEIRKPPIVEGLYIPSLTRLKLDVNPKDPDNVYVGITYVCRSDDGGKSWQMAGKYCQPGTQQDPLNIHGDIHAVSFIPGTNDILIGTDGGVFRYLASEKKDIDLNQGLNISQVLGMSAPAQAPHKIMIGKQDTGYDIYDGHEWTNFYGGDGYSISASPIDTTLYLSNFGFMFRARDQRPFLDNVTSCKAREPALFSIVAYDPIDQNRCFIGGTHISYTGDGAKTFSVIYKYHSAVGQPVDFDSQIESIGVGHDQMTGESVVYASSYGFYNGNLCKMTKGRIPTLSHDKPCTENLCSTCWTKISLPTERFDWLNSSAFSITGIAVSPADPEELWICYEHAGGHSADLKVFHSTDGGTSWSDMDKALPEYTNCTAIKYDDKTKFLYLGTSLGVYINRNDGAGWKVFGEELPASYVKVLEISQSIGKIRAGLYGRGVWEADLAGN